MGRVHDCADPRSSCWHDCRQVQEADARTLQNPCDKLAQVLYTVIGRPPNSEKGIPKVQQAKWQRLVKEFIPTTRGKVGYFLKDEEELFVITLEEAWRAAFPYDTDMLERMANKAGKLVYGEDFVVGRKWRMGFERRWRDRLTSL